MVRSIVRVVVVALVLGAGVAHAEPAARVVDAAEARKLAAAGVKVVDVRTAVEFAMGHVPGAVNIPFDEMEKRHAELGPASTPVLLYCRSGRRSGIAEQTLRQLGYSQVENKGGLDDMLRGGHQTE